MIEFDASTMDTASSCPVVAKGKPSSGNIALRERRLSPRRALNEPMLVVPVLPNGYPDSEHVRTATIRDLSTGGIGLEFAVEDWKAAAELMVGFRMPDGLWHYAGVEVCNAGPPVAGRVRVGCQFNRQGQEILQPENLTPTLDADTLLFAHYFPPAMLEKWAELGVLQQNSLDRVQLCPRCQGFPTFRPGCRQCGSADVGNDRLMHHFACAHVGLIADFETPAGLVCPKCRTRSLVVGADYEYLTGQYVCRQCAWSDMELEQVARCLRCGFSFPAHQAHLQEVGGYRARRLEPQAVLDRLEQCEHHPGQSARPMTSVAPATSPCT